MNTPSYQVDSECTAEEFRSLLLSSGLGSRRPIDDTERLDAMLRNSNLVVTARVDGLLVGIARSITDSAFCCYLSDLAVSKEIQGMGIGARLVQETKKQIGPKVSLILNSVPESTQFYESINMQKLPDCYWIRREK